MPRLYPLPSHHMSRALAGALILAILACSGLVMVVGATN